MELCQILNLTERLSQLEERFTVLDNRIPWTYRGNSFRSAPKERRVRGTPPSKMSSSRVSTRDESESMGGSKVDRSVRSTTQSEYARP